MSIRNAARDARTIKHLLEGAEREALADGEELWGAEHLVLAALALAEGSARRAFERAGLDPDGYRAAIGRQHDAALASVGVEPCHAPAQTPIQASAKRFGPEGTANGRSLFQAAGALGRIGKDPFSGAHVIIALTEMEHGTAVRALAAMGVDRAALARSAREELEGAAAVR